MTAERRRCNPDRPEPAEAIWIAFPTGATPIIARLDRLSRNAAFLLALRDSGAHFLAVDMPEANDLIVGIMALVAEAERQAISRRTKEALAVAKARGVRLGNPNGAAAMRRAGKGGATLRAAVARNAADHARDLASVVQDIKAAGHVTMRAIAAELDRRGIRTRRGGRWQVSNARNLLEWQRANAAKRRCHRHSGVEFALVCEPPVSSHLPVPGVCSIDSWLGDLPFLRKPILFGKRPGGQGCEFPRRTDPGFPSRSDPPEGYVPWFRLGSRAGSPPSFCG